MDVNRIQAQDNRQGVAPSWNGIERRAPHDRRIINDRRQGDRRQGDRRGLGASDDPMNLYLRDMGDLHLLSQEEEVGLARMVEEGEKQIQSAILRLTLGMTALEDLAADLQRGTVRITTVLKGLPDDESDEIA